MCIRDSTKSAADAAEISPMEAMAVPVRTKLRKLHSNMKAPKYTKIVILVISRSAKLLPLGKN